MAYFCVDNTNYECSGCMDCQPTPHYYCPVCGNEVYETVFVSEGEVIGCENCTEIKEPQEVMGYEAD